MSIKYDSSFNPIRSKISRQVYNTEIVDNNFHQDSTSEVTEDFDYNIDSSATTLLLNTTNWEAPNSNSYLPLEHFSLLILHSSDYKFDSTSTPSFEIDFYPSAFEEHVLNTTSSLRDDFSYSSCSSCPSSNLLDDFSYSYHSSRLSCPSATSKFYLVFKQKIWSQSH